MQQDVMLVGTMQVGVTMLTHPNGKSSPIYDEIDRDRSLEECPFCKSATAPHLSQAWDDINRTYLHQWNVVCDFNMGGCGGASGFRSSKDEAVETWNRRGGWGPTST